MSPLRAAQVRAFYPESGRQMFEIVDAHKQGVTALAVTSDSGRLVTGGGEGQVRVWQIEQGVTPKVLALCPTAQCFPYKCSTVPYTTQSLFLNVL